MQKPILTLISFLFFFYSHAAPLHLHSFPTRRSSDLCDFRKGTVIFWLQCLTFVAKARQSPNSRSIHESARPRSEEHTSELQSPYDLVCRLLLEKKKKIKFIHMQLHTNLMIST